MIRVMIAEDMEPIRRLYRKFIDAAEDMTVVGEAATGAEAVEIAGQVRPDVILMDIEMETKDAGLRAMRSLDEAGVSAKVIILTVYEEDDLIFTAFQLGACDYVMKNAPEEDVLRSIRDAAGGTSPLRPELASKILGELRRVRSYETSFLYAVNIVSALTDTELETLRLTLDGMSRREICAARGVEMSTVKSQIHSLLRKFNRKSMDEVVALIEELHLQDLIPTLGSSRGGSESSQ